ncbi:AMP-binding protein [Massilia pseudoviolaceinigra]|uniref:AMP-binding protein n=1 Tax=Massilia pseudoviolaceinigra TaxID=3057165 RepID=UPI0027969425|nr:AMP-binding protein [Massilia sp. CCM 9206]MDQ1924673.1 AMP-binding protein [Massilia sp. CCM 9206]
MDKQRFELSRSQQAVFTMEAFQLSGHHFYLGGVARLRGAVTLEQLAQAVAVVRDSHDVFRIGFIVDAVGAWHGIRQDRPHSQIEHVDFSCHADPEQAFSGWAERQLLLEEDLELAPIRIFVVRFNGEQAGWFVKAHHAAADGAALALVMEHLSSALESGRCAASPAFTLLACGERDYEGSDRFRRDAQYWRQLFGDVAQAAGPSLRARAPIGDYRARSARSMRIRFALSDVQNDTLHRFKQVGGSVFRLFFAAVAYAQMVVEDSDGALLQAPMLNRWSDDEKQAVAMGVAPVLVPVSRAAGESATECYRTLKQALQKAVVHSRFAPGARWSEFASPAWRKAVPAFGVSYQTGVFRETVSGAEVDIDHLQAVEALFATIHIHDRFDGGRFRLEADFRQQWSAAQCEAFLAAVVNHAMAVAAEILEEPNGMAEAQAASLVEPIGVHLQAAFERYADHCMFKYAQSASSVTYREGWNWIGHFGEQLRRYSRQAGPNAPVLILGRRLPETTLAYLACLIDNVIVVPVCPTTPAARLQTIVRNSGAGLCIFSSTDRQLAESFGLPLLQVALDRAMFQLQAAPAPAVADTGRPAYILYTSGSTGEPKGVAISPVALAHYALAATAAYAGDGPFSTPLFTSFGFDLTQTSILVPVLSGGFIQVWDQDLRDEPGMLRALLTDEALTAVKCTPSHLSLLTEHGQPRRNPLTFVVGGENLSAALVNKALSFFPPGSRVINEYGPTETTVGCCIYTVNRPNEERTPAGTITPIGEALGAAYMSIRDSWGELVPLGFKGEIWIGGPVLADGYVGNAAQTAAKFVAGPDGRGRWYRTGDLGVQDEQGQFHCLGRVDDEFKLRGHRIHPAEIEKAVEGALARCGGVSQRWELKALKLTVAGEDAIVLCSSEPLPEHHPHFQAHLSAELPEAWRPSRYCPVKPWPVNANGKVDSAALAAAVASQMAATDALGSGAGSVSTRHGTYQMPEWLDEAFLRPIWPQVVNWHGSFLEQGGDSIKAIRLAGLLARHGVRIGAAELLTSRALGAVLEAACAAAQTRTGASEAAEQAVDAGWISHLPAARWFHQQRFEHGDRLQQGIVLTLPASLSAERIHAAVEAVKARHGVFSLRVDPVSGAWRLAPATAQASRVHALPQDGRLESRLQNLQAEVSLGERPSVHEIVTVAGADSRHLLWVCHHLLCDVHSWIYLLDELDQALGQTPLAAARAEHGVFLWGKWLHELGVVPASVPPAAAEPLPTGATASLALTASAADLQWLTQRLKADRAELIAAAMLDLAREDGMLPPQPLVLFENPGRPFAEAGVPAGWRGMLDQAVGWFTGFELVPVVPGAGVDFLRLLKTARNATRHDWGSRLGLENGGVAPLLCINDIGLGLGGRTAWHHFSLDPALSGGYRHPADAGVASFDLQVGDSHWEGKERVTVLLTVAGARDDMVRRYLSRLDVRLLSLGNALRQGMDDPLARQALLPSDFPLCQLSQFELDLILNGATV